MTNKESITQTKERYYSLAIKENTEYSSTTKYEYILHPNEAVNLLSHPSIEGMEVAEITCLISLDKENKAVIDVIYERRNANKKELAEYYYSIAKLFLRHFRNLNRYSIEFLDKAKNIDVKTVLPL